jgi:hypothetical protein
MVRDSVPGSTLVQAEDASPDKRSYRVDCDRIGAAVPRFKPRWTAQMGVEEVYEVVRGSGLKAEDFEGARYNRIAHVRALIDEGRLDPKLRWTAAARGAAAAWATASS